jgi:SAM-dependent methyltransferase
MRIRTWLHARDLDLLFGSYPYFIPRKLLREQLRGPASEVHGMLIDLGCGYKPYRPFFKQVTAYIGLDSDGRRRPDVVGVATAAPFADAVLCTELLEHCPSPDEVVREIARILKPGGTLLLSSPMSWNLHYEPHDYYRFTRYWLQVIVARAGLETASVSRIGGVFAMTGARLTEVICKTTARALKFVPTPIRLLIVRVLYTGMTSVFFTASRLFDWVDKTDAIGWLLVGRKPGPTVHPFPEASLRTDAEGVSQA